MALGLFFPPSSSLVWAAVMSDGAGLSATGRMTQRSPKEQGLISFASLPHRVGNTDYLGRRQQVTEAVSLGNPAMHWFARRGGENEGACDFASAAGTL